MTKVFAKDKKCVTCGKQANAFFGMADPDVVQYPYCNKCIKEMKVRIYMELEVKR